MTRTDEEILGFLRGPDGAEHVARFWSHVAIGGADDCWEWQATRAPKGYGQFSIAGCQMRSNRVAFAIANGSFPPLACHTCDNPPCCNPKHLFGGTVKDNVDDMISKGRERFSKLTVAQVVEARDLALAGETFTSIAPRFGVSRETIRRAIRGESWTRLGAAPDSLAIAPPAENLRTHCRHGHEYSPENTARSRGKRYCITCQRNRDANRGPRPRAFKRVTP